MKRTLFACLVLTVMVAVSCKKNKDEEAVPDSVQAPQTFDNYCNLKIGNYWIYQEFNIDASGNSSAGTDIDSC